MDSVVPMYPQMRVTPSGIGDVKFRCESTICHCVKSCGDASKLTSRLPLDPGARGSSNCVSPGLIEDSCPPSPLRYQKPETEISDAHQGLSRHGNCSPSVRLFGRDASHGGRFCSRIPDGLGDLLA